MTLSTAADDFITKKKPFEFFFQKQKTVCEYLYQFRHNFILKINKKNGENAFRCLLFVILLSSFFVIFIRIYFSNILIYKRNYFKQFLLMQVTLEWIFLFFTYLTRDKSIFRLLKFIFRFSERTRSWKKGAKFRLIWTNIY